MLLVLLGLGVFAGLRWVAALPEPPEPSPIFTEQVVVVGVTGRPQLTAVDQQVIEARPDEVQAGAVSIRPRYVGDCAAAGWTTLGAGRRAAVGGLCTPEVRDGAIVDWAERTQAAAARRGDARLGTLADSVTAAWPRSVPERRWPRPGPTGRWPVTRRPRSSSPAGWPPTCPITLVDAGARSDEVITALAADDTRTLIVTGIGPVARLATTRRLQVFYRVGTTFPGWATSASTRRTGVLTLTDLTRTLVDFGAGPGDPAAPIDGSPLAVDRATLTVGEHSRPPRRGRRALRHHPRGLPGAGQPGGAAGRGRGGRAPSAATPGWSARRRPSGRRCRAPCC